MEFRCGNYSNSTSFPCGNDGQCILTPEGYQKCACPPGWKRDYVGFAHFDNCYLPDQFLPVFFIVYSSILLPCLAIEIFVLWRARNRALKMKRKGMYLMVVWHFWNWVHVLCVFAQDGFFEAGLVSLVIYLYWGHVMGAYLLTTFVESLAVLGKFSHSLGRIRTSIWILFAVLAIALSASMLAAIPYCRLEDVTSYNTTIYVMVFMSIILVVFNQGIIIFAAKKLDRIFRSTSIYESLSSNLILERQTKIRKQIRDVVNVNLTFTVGAGATLIVPIVWSIFGSIPYFFIGWAIQFLLCLSTFPMTFSQLGRMAQTESRTTVADEVSKTPESLERRGYETIIINNPAKKVAKWTSRLANRAIPRNPLMSKIIEEEQNESRASAPRSDIPSLPAPGLPKT